MCSGNNADQVLCVQRFKGYDTDPQEDPDIEQSQYVQSYIKIFQLSLCLLATERFSLGLLAHVHGHVGGLPSGGETATASPCVDLSTKEK